MFEAHCSEHPKAPCKRPKLLLHESADKDLRRSVALRHTSVLMVENIRGSSGTLKAILGSSYRSDAAVQAPAMVHLLIDDYPLKAASRAFPATCWALRQDGMP